MPHRISYDVMAPQAEVLFQKVVAARTPEEMDARYKDYITYIEACGWTVQEYDNEQLKRVDMGWNEPKTN